MDDIARPVSAPRVLGVAALLGGSALTLGLGAPTPWTGVVFVLAWLLFFLLGSAWVPHDWRALSDEHAWAPALRFAVVATAAGLGTAILLWSLAALWLKSLLAGTAISLAGCTLGAFRLLRRRAPVPSLVWPLPLIVMGVAFACGFYFYGINEIRVGGDLLFTYRWDVAHHMYWAGLVQALGLPMVEHNGAIDMPLMTLYHTGVLVATAGIGEASGLTAYQAGRVLAIGCTVLLAAASATLVARSGLRAWQIALGALSPLAFAGFSIPLDMLRLNLSGLLDPYAASVAPFSAASGSLYHSIPQVAAVAVGAAALVVVDHFRSEHHRSLLALAGWLMGTTLGIKPTLAILLLPAMVLALGIQSDRRHTFVLFSAGTAVGMLPFFLPKALADLPAAPPWSTLPLSGVLQIDTLVQLAAAGVAVPIFIVRLWRLLRLGFDSWETIDVVLLALGGGMLFAAVFVEPGSRSAQGNQYWPRNAALVLAAPFLVATVLRFADTAFEAGSAKSLRVAALGAVGLLCTHLAGGLLYATRYPWINSGRIEYTDADELREISRRIPPSARLLADVVSPEVAYLPRRFVFGGSWSEVLQQDLDLWRRLRRGEWNDTLRAFVTARDGIVLGPRTEHLRPRLRDLAWSEKWTGTRHSYWAPVVPGPVRLTYRTTPANKPRE